MNPGSPAESAGLAPGDVRTVVIVRTKKAVVFTTTTPKAALHAGKLYFVFWRPAKTLHGTLSYCVHSLSSGGAPSPQSCTTVTLR